MKKILIIYLLVALNFLSYSQYNCDGRINCIIFIDGKIPLYSIIGNLEYCDSGNEKHFMEFQYSVGEIRFIEEDINILQSLSKEKMITINLIYTEFKRGIPKGRYTYSINLSLFLLIENEHIILNITNLNKKKRTYYFGYSTSLFSTVPHKKEQEILQRTW